MTSGAKARKLLTNYGTAEAVPFQENQALTRTLNTLACDSTRQ